MCHVLCAGFSVVAIGAAYWVVILLDVPDACMTPFFHPHDKLMFSDEATSFWQAACCRLCLQIDTCQ